MKHSIAWLFAALLFSLSAHVLANPDDEFWSDQFSLSGFDGRVDKIVSDDQGNIYVGGNFDFVDGIFVGGLAKWDGSAWSSLVPTTDRRRGTRVEDMLVDSAGNLYPTIA